MFYAEEFSMSRLHPRILLVGALVIPRILVLVMFNRPVTLVVMVLAAFTASLKKTLATTLLPPAHGKEIVPLLDC